jgi:hypothetical protein
MSIRMRKSLAKRDALVSMLAVRGSLRFQGTLDVQQRAVVRSGASCICRVVD